MCSNHELQATLNALGYLEDGVYYKSRDCTNCAKDLVRYLRRDDPNEKTIRLELLKTDVISNDLIPLLKVLKPKKENELFDLTLRLLVNLTQSAVNCFEMKVPEDKQKYNTFIEIDNALQKTKDSFTDEKFILIICDKLKEIISKSWEDRKEEEDMICERILFLLRNILHIKISEDDNKNRLDTDINAHDLMILSMHKANLFELLNQMTANTDFNKYSSHVLEIIVLALQDQSPEELAKVSDKEVNLKSKRSVVEKEKDSDDLLKLLNKDKQVKKMASKFRSNSRHSRFMGTYVATNMKSINDDNNLIVHKQAKNMEDLLDDKSKQKIKKSKNKLALEADESHHRSILFIRIILKEFCLSFMKDCYNTFLRNLRDLIARKRLDDEEINYYYWLIQFLTEFNRNCDIDEQVKIEQIKETFSLEIFHSVEIYIQRCIEMMRMEKKQWQLWSKRMHVSLKCYKENLITLYALEKKISAFNEANQITQTPSTLEKSIENTEEDLVAQAENIMEASPVKSPVKEAAEPKSLLDERVTALLTKLKNQIFYIQEFRELFITLLRDFDQNKMSKAFLRDLIEANHIFIMLMEFHTKKTGVLSVMSRKKKSKKSKKKAPKEKKAKETKEEREERLAEQKLYKKRVDEQKIDFKTFCWQSQFSKIGSLIQNETEIKCEETDLMPFNFGMVTNDEEFDAQKDGVIEKIQSLLSKKKPDESITLFREARSLWPQDKKLFGYEQIAADEEFEVFKELYMKEIEIKKPEKKEAKKPDEQEEVQNNDEGIEDDLYNDELGGEVEEAYESENVNYEEQEENLDFEKFLFRYTHPHVIKCMILMLSEYAKNSDFLNRCCMNMFERIAYECHSTPCLYQLSLFNLINKMYRDPLSRCTMNICDTKSQKKSIDDLYASTYSAEDMFAFFRQLIAKFFEQTKKNDKLILEVLFFKDKKVLFSLGEDSGGYEALQTQETKKKKVAWTQDEQDELKSLYSKFNDNELPSEGDIIDHIMMEISDGDRKRKEICNQLVNIGCASTIDEFKESDAKKLGRNKLWRPEDHDDLKQCFNLVKENAEQTNRALTEMMPQLQECLKIKRSKNVIVDKLIELELIKERDEIIAGKKKQRDKTNFLTSNLTDEFVVSDKSIDEDEQPKKSILKKKKKTKKSKKSKNNSEKSNKNDLFDAESDSSSDNSDNSDSSSSSESESDTNSKKKPFKLSLSDNDDDTPKATTKSDESSSDEIAKKPSKQMLKLSESDGSNSEGETTLKKKSKPAKKKKKSEKLMTNDNVLKLILSESEDEKPDNDADLISNLLTKETKKSDVKKTKTISSDESDSEPSIAKENIHSDQMEEAEEEIIKTKPSKKRKKKLKIFDDSSNSSSHSNTDSSASKPVLSEIINSDNSQNIKLNNVEALNRVAEEDVIEQNNNNDDSDSSDDDDDMPLGMKLSMPKRQRLILSDGDDD